MRQRVFIGSSSEAIDVCRAVQQELERYFEVTIWDQDVFRLTYDAIDSLCAELDSSDAGVFVLTPDDLTERHGQFSFTVRDNVIFELGMFIGRLGRSRTFMLAPDESDIRLPSDLIGVTTARYDAERFDRRQRAAVGSACTQITQALKSIQPQASPEPRFRARLDRAMSRMSKDLEYLLADHRSAPGDTHNVFEWPGSVSFQIERTAVKVEVGRIQDYQLVDKRTVMVLPANEYFDDGCISDPYGSLGAFVQHHFENRVADFTKQIRAALEDVPSERVHRNERQVDDSYGIGEAIFLGKLEPDYRVILASVTTERTGVGLHAEPHFIYAAVEGIVETMNERRLNSLVMPVLGSGHGEISLSTAILFNLLSVRSILAEDRGRHLKEVRLIIFDGDAGKIAPENMYDIISRVSPAARSVYR
jgi:O-acetyl-ADP-ribose deacetylase (regulator of RNase III)